MGEENQKRISGVKNPIEYVVDELKSSPTPAVAIKKAGSVLEIAQEAVNRDISNDRVANDVVENQFKTPIDLVGYLKRAEQDESERKYQEARNER